jgi:predicted O-methyltransferase YrrM
MHSVGQYLWHWLTAVNEHSLHSPFIYNLYTRTIKKDIASEDFAVIEAARTNLLSSTDKIKVTQLGANSKVNNDHLRPIADIARKGIASAKTSKLLFNLIGEFKCKNVIELGTSFGINTMYLAANTTVKVTTFEGCRNTASIARENFKNLGYTNIELVEGNIDTTLPLFKSNTINKIDLALIDANHKLKPTIAYFNHLLHICNDHCIIVVDDIYWSVEMTKAWRHLQEHPSVSVSVDLYELGILFIQPELGKEHYKLMF